MSPVSIFFMYFKTVFVQKRNVSAINMTNNAADNIVFLKMWLSHIAGSESQIESLVQRMRFSALSPHLQKYKKRYRSV